MSKAYVCMMEEGWFCVWLMKVVLCMVEEGGFVCD